MLSHLSRFVTLRALAGVTCIALAGATGSLRAADPLPAPAPVAKPIAISDVALSRAILAALDADPQLKKINLIVSVVDRGVVVGGPVVSEEIRKRVEVVVRGVAGVESVKNTCFVDAAPEPLLRAVTERMKPDAKPIAAALPGVVPPPDRTEGFIPQLPPQQPTDLVVNAPKPVEALRPSGPAVNVLGAPVVAPGTGGVPRINPLPTVAPPPVKPLFPTAPVALNASPAEPADLPTTLARLRTDDRFKSLKVEKKSNGELQVTGSAARPADVWAFIAEIRKVPGLPRTTPHPDLVK